MNQSEFINAVLHKPWVNRACSFDAMDCWGLVVMYYEHVLGVTLPKVDGYEDGSKSIIDGVTEQLCLWERVDRPHRDGVVFLAFDGELPAHVGVVISRTKMLHSRGCEETGGNVSIHSIKTMIARYNKVEFYKFRGING